MYMYMYIYTLQPITLVRVTKGALPTSSASAKTAARRTKSLRQVRLMVSGGDEQQQMQVEVKSLPQQEREKMLRSAGLCLDIPEGQGLAIKCDVGLPWNKL